MFLGWYLVSVNGAFEEISRGHSPSFACPVDVNFRLPPKPTRGSEVIALATYSSPRYFYAKFARGLLINLPPPTICITTLMARQRTNNGRFEVMCLMPILRYNRYSPVRVLPVRTETGVLFRLFLGKADVATAIAFRSFSPSQHKIEPRCRDAEDFPDPDIKTTTLHRGGDYF